jgi:hypothetical protein
VRNEEIKTRRTAYRYFRIRQRSGHGDGIGEQQSSAQLQQSGPLRICSTGLPGRAVLSERQKSITGTLAPAGGPGFCRCVGIAASSSPFHYAGGRVRAVRRARVAVLRFSGPSLGRVNFRSIVGSRYAPFHLTPNMQMWPRDSSRFPGKSQSVTLPKLVPRLHLYLRQMHVDSEEPLPMIHDHAVAFVE